MGLKESLIELQKKENISVKKEVKKELAKIKKTTTKCILCSNTAKYFLKGTTKGYCKECAEDNFADLKCLQKK